MKLIKTIPLLVVSLLLIVISVANRQEVIVSLWPMPFEKPLPLFWVFFAGVFVGLLLAGILLAFKGVRHYVDMRGAKKETTKLAKEIDALEGELDKKPPKIEQKDYSEKPPS